jgi:hypothetical protein
MKAGMEWLHRNDGFHIGQNSVGNWSFLGTYTGNGFADLLTGFPDNGTRSPVQTLQGAYDDFKAWHFNYTFRVRPGLTLNFGIRWDINPFMKGIRRTRTGFDPSTGKVIVPSGLQNDLTAQPLTGLLLQLFGDRVSFTDDLGLPPSVSPSDHRNVAPRVGIAWTPMPKTVIRSAYGWFLAFPDTNLINNTVVTVPFVLNSQVFNDRPPAAPTRTFSNFFQGAAIASPNPNPGQPCSFGLVLNSCDTPTMTSALVNLREQYTEEWNLTVEREITSRVAFTAAYVGSRTVRLQQSQRRNDPPPGAGPIKRGVHFRRAPSACGMGRQGNLQRAADFARSARLARPDANGFLRPRKCLDNADDSGAPSQALIGLTMRRATSTRPTRARSVSTMGSRGTGKQFPNHLRSGGPVLGGWELAAVTTFKSGLPFTPTIGSDRANTGAGACGRTRSARHLFRRRSTLVLYFRQLKLPLAVPECNGQFLCPGAIHNRYQRPEHSARGQSGTARSVDSEGREDHGIQARSIPGGVLQYPESRRVQRPRSQYRPGIGRAGFLHAEQQPHHRICA